MNAPDAYTLHAKLYAQAPFREAMTWSNTQGRGIERMATGFREDLVDFATGHTKVGIEDVQRSIHALREQLTLLEGRCLAIHRERLRLREERENRIEDGE